MYHTDSHAATLTLSRPTIEVYETDENVIILDDGTYGIDIDVSNEVILACSIANPPGAIIEYRFLKDEKVLQEWQSIGIYTIDDFSAKDAGSGYTCQAGDKDAVEVVKVSLPLTLTLGKM